LGTIIALVNIFKKQKTRIFPFISSCF